MNRHSSPVCRRSPPAAPYLPSLREIEAACARIRAGWDDEERRKRAGLGPENQWQLLAISLGVLDGQL